MTFHKRIQDYGLVRDLSTNTRRNLGVKGGDINEQERKKEGWWIYRIVSPVTCTHTHTRTPTHIAPFPGCQCFPKTLCIRIEPKVSEPAFHPHIYLQPAIYTRPSSRGRTAVAVDGNWGEGGGGRAGFAAERGNSKGVVRARVCVLSMCV